MLKITISSLHQKRIIGVGLLLIGISLATALVLYALKQNINLFYSPTEVSKGNAPAHHVFRLGGMLKKDTLIRKEGLKVEFVLTDYETDITVHYNGILPDLFKEGRGVVALGQLQNGFFVAKEVLARHDENYMPPEVSHAIETAHPGQTNPEEEIS